MKTKLYLMFLIVLSTQLFFESVQANFFMKDVINGYERNSAIENVAFEGVIIRFVLVDADTNEDLTTLTDGMQVRADDIQGRNLNIRLELNDGSVRVLQVDFKLSGPLVINHSEKVLPHALLGDITGNYNGQPFPPGSYTLWAGANDSTTPHYWDELEIHFEIGDFENSLSDFELVHPEGDYVFPIIFNNQQFNSNKPEAFSLEVKPKTYKIGSVAFELQGPLKYSHVENVAPFTLFGDSDGDYYGKILPEGFYTLTATPYSLPNKKGEKGEARTIQFSVEDLLDLSLNSPFLVDANTDENLLRLSEYDNNPIDNSEIPTENANIDFGFTFGVKSVHFSLSGEVSYKSIENVYPYALFGDNAGDFNGRNLPVGHYSLIATPYAQNNGQGKPGFSSFYEFEIINSDQELFSLISLKTSDNFATIYPNPAHGEITLGNRENVSPRTITIIDFFGIEIKSFSQKTGLNQPLDISDLSKGIYMVRIDNGKTSTVKKLIMQ